MEDIYADKSMGVVQKSKPKLFYFIRRFYKLDGGITIHTPTVSNLVTIYLIFEK